MQEIYYQSALSAFTRGEMDAATMGALFGFDALSAVYSSKSFAGFSLMPFLPSWAASLFLFAFFGFFWLS
jgi:hypothetical protein